MVEQEASLIVGLGILPAGRNRIGLCELLRLCVFFFSSTLAQIAVLLQGDPVYLRESRSALQCSNQLSILIAPKERPCAFDLLGPDRESGCRFLRHSKFPQRSSVWRIKRIVRSVPPFQAMFGVP